MTEHKMSSLQIAKLFIGLEEVRLKIHSEILPLCTRLAPEETIELAQTLDLATSAIEQFQKQTKIQMTEAK